MTSLERELVEDLDTLAEKVIFGKNQNRSYASGMPGSPA